MDLQLWYRDALGATIAELRSMRHVWDTDPAAVDPELRRMAHALKGSGGSFGFPEISTGAAAAESAKLGELGGAIDALLGVLDTVIASPQPKQVLVVDDDPLIARLLEVKLAGADRRVIATNRLEIARQMLKTDPIDLVVLDLFLPDGDGRTLLSEIRSNPATASLPVFVITAGAPEAYRAQCDALGADLVIVKPFNPDALAHALSLALRTATHDGIEARSALVGRYRMLASSQTGLAVGAVIPETHGPGGRSPDDRDEGVTPLVEWAIREALGRRGAVARWSSGELAVVAEDTPEVLVKLLDRVRLRLRTRAHPVVESAIVSFSGAVVHEIGERQLADVYSQTRHLAEQVNRAGGDRVIVATDRSDLSRVLLAEDDAYIAALVRHRLEQCGYQVHHVMDGLEAVAAADREAYRFIVLDVMMPGLDGFEVLTRIRRSALAAETPVVMLTSVDTEREVVRGFELGADDYILKPFSPLELTARLDRFGRRR